MARITWLGEDELHEGGQGPAFTVWRDITFPKGEAVEVDYPPMIEKARANRFFSVEEEPAPVGVPEDPDLPKRRVGRPRKAAE